MYEYKILKIDTYSKKRLPQSEQTLNDLADQGWEPFMVSSTDIELTHTVFLRRPKPDGL
jgi:hypothetical protein